MKAMKAKGKFSMQQQLFLTCSCRDLSSRGSQRMSLEIMQQCLPELREKDKRVCSQATQDFKICASAK